MPKAVRNSVLENWGARACWAEEEDGIDPNLPEVRAAGLAWGKYRLMNNIRVITWL
jgi:hypothetical protein